MRVAMTGASGFIGTRLVARLEAAGHSIISIGRATSSGVGPDVVWDVATHLDGAALEGVDAVVHLAGASIGERWTDVHKTAIRASRVQGTALLARTIASLRKKPSVLVSQSAIGIYGDRGDELIDERSSPGTGFLAEVVRVWEGSADPAREAGIRVVHPRTGIVLNPKGGALEKLLPFFSLGVGGKIGSGRQWMSWVALTDVVDAFDFLLSDTTLEGAVNLTAPNPATNAEFSKTLATVLGRPAFATVPEFAVKLLYGQMGQETVIAGQRVLPTRLLAAGFRFQYPELEGALRHELDR
jgi:uncharacterized protein